MGGRGREEEEGKKRKESSNGARTTEQCPEYGNEGRSRIRIDKG